ncbi:TPA: hypothetical protein ACI7E0_003504 [Escherichia coli]
MKLWVITPHSIAITAMVTVLGAAEAFMMLKHGEMAMKQGKRLSKYIVMSGVGE